MSLEGQSEMVTKTNREEIYYPGGQSHTFADSALSNYSYSPAVQPAGSEYSGYNSHDLGAGTTYTSQAQVQEMSLKGDPSNWQLSNASGHSMALPNSGYGSLNMNSQYFQQATTAQNSPSQSQNNHQSHTQPQSQQSSTSSSASSTPSGTIASQSTGSVKYEDRFSQQQQSQSQPQTTTSQSQSQTQSQQSSGYSSATSQDFTSASLLGVTGGGSSNSGGGGGGGGSGGGSSGQSHYTSYLDQAVKAEDSPYRYSCGSTTSPPGGSPGTRSVAGSSHNSQDSDYSGPSPQPTASSVYGLMGMAVTTTATSTQSTVASTTPMKTEVTDAGYYMPTTCSAPFMSGLTANNQTSGSGGYSPHTDNSGVNSLHQQYKLKSETGYYGSSPDYGSTGYGAMDRYTGYKRTGPYDRVVGQQQAYGRQRETPPGGLTPPLGGVGQNYTMEELQHQQQQQMVQQQNHHHQQMAAMMYMRHGSGNHHQQADLAAMHQVLPQIESLYNRTGSGCGGGSAADNPRMVVSPMSHLMYPSSHDAHQAARQQLTPPMGHVVRGGGMYGQDPDMQQIQTMVQSYTGRPGTDHHHQHHQRPLVDMDGEPTRTTPPVVWTDPKMDFPLPEVRDIAGTFLLLEKQLCEALRVLEFRSPVEYIYNPMEYAWEPHTNYVTRYCTTQKPVLFLGMNPGPFGMAQTGVPFGEVTLVKEWMGVSGNVNKPVREHPKKLILGFDCPRSEVLMFGRGHSSGRAEAVRGTRAPRALFPVSRPATAPPVILTSYDSSSNEGTPQRISGSRFWGFFKKYCGKPENFFRYCFVHNICPLIFMNHNAKNITPPQLPVVERKPLNRLCSQHLCDVVRLLNAKIVIGIGKFAQDQAKMALEEAGITGVKVTWIMHPSPANPIANRGWEEVAKRQLEEMDVLKYIADPSV